MFKTGLGLYKIYRQFLSRIGLLRFTLKKWFLGFDVANDFIQRVDKFSLEIILKSYGAQIGENCDINTGLIFHNNKDYSNLIIGDNCHIGKNCFFDLRDKIVIGDNVVISMQTTFITHLDMSKSNLSKKFKSNSDEIIIKDNSYIGTNSTILSGIILGNSGFVGAKSLVNKNVEENSIVGGIPIKELKVNTF